MNVETYLRKRALVSQRAARFRKLCLNCLQPDFSCYCAWLKPFDPKIQFVILIHPLEFKKRIATGRMSHLSLRRSKLIMGEDFSRNLDVEELLADPSFEHLMLYPGRNSRNLTHLTAHERNAMVPDGKKLSLFVIDGSWSTARKMVRLSENLKSLARVCFTPPGPSSFRIRRQPRQECYSTIEAIHHTIELLGPACGFDTPTGEHDSLLDLFDKMVRRQIDLAYGQMIQISKF